MIEYDFRLIHLLLKIVKNNGNIQNLVNPRLNYTEIYKYINHLKRNGLINDIYGELEITNLGIKAIEEFNLKSKNKHTDKWISPQQEYFIEKWDIFKVYLP